MKYIPYEFDSKTYWLSFTGAAMFDIQDQFGEDANLTQLVLDPGRGGFDAVCTILPILSEQGELLRRYMGHTPQEALTEGALRVGLGKLQLMIAKQAVISAILAGYGREIAADDAQDVDEGLAELQKKTN